MAPRRVAAWQLCLAAAPVIIGVYYLLVQTARWPGVQVALYVSANAALAIAYQAGNFLDAFWMSASLCAAAGVLHPSVPKMISASNTATPDATPGRLAVLALAAVTAPTSIVIQHYSGGQEHVVAAAAVCNLVFLLVMLPDTTTEHAAEIAERIRRGVSAAPIAVDESRLHTVTVSVGIAGMPAAGGTDELVLAADRALYAAKNAGRNRVAGSAA